MYIAYQQVIMPYYDYWLKNPLHSEFRLTSGFESILTSVAHMPVFSDYFISTPKYSTFTS